MFQQEQKMQVKEIKSKSLHLIYCKSSDSSNYIRSITHHVLLATTPCSENGTDGLQVVPSGPSMRAIPRAANSFLISSDFSYCFAFLAEVLSSIFCSTWSSVMEALCSAFSRSCCRAWEEKLVSGALQLKDRSHLYTSQVIQQSLLFWTEILQSLW